MGINVIFDEMNFEADIVGKFSGGDDYSFRRCFYHYFLNGCFYNHFLDLSLCLVLIDQLNKWHNILY